MSKVTRVVVLCPNGRRQTVNLSPNSSVLQILEEVCKKQNLNPDDYDICHFKKPMDLTLPVRFANISNNAQLELEPVKVARKDSLVTIVLQLESGERIMKDFVPSTSIEDVIKQCLGENPNKMNLDKKGEPVCVYMRQKLVGDAIKGTSLRNLGLTKGSAIIRLLYRNPEDLLDQAHVSAPLSKPPKETSPIHTEKKLSDTSTKMECDPPVDNLKTDSEVEKIEKNAAASVIPDDHKSAPAVSSLEEKRGTPNLHEAENKEKIVYRRLNECSNTNVEQSHVSEQKMELDAMSVDNQDSTTEEEEIGAIHYIGGRHAVVYSLDDITDIKKADLPDEFFELTVEDVRYLMEEFKRSRAEIESQPLLTKELRNRQLHQRLGRFKQTVIRVYFPERLVLQAVFEAQETVQDVCEFIRNYLEDKSLNFYLYSAPPKEKKDPSKTLIESMLIPAAVVYFGCDKSQESYLMKSLKEKISDPRAASLAAYESRKEAISDDTEDLPIELPEEIANPPVEVNVDSDKVPGPSFSQASSFHPSQSSEKVPKWLKLSRK